MKNCWLLLGLALVVLSGCGGNAGNETTMSADSTTVNASVESPSSPSAIGYAEAFDKAQDNKFVSVEGYLSLPNMMYTTGKTAQVNLFARPLQRHGAEITSNIQMGGCNNCMSTLPEKYKASDLRLKADDGTEILADQRVRITGGLHVSDNSLADNGLMVSIDVQKIEKVAEQPVDYSSLGAVKLDKSNLEDSTLKYALTFAQGILTIPSLLFMENDVSLYLSIGGKDVSMNFLFGTGPNQIEEIPENYSKADFKIHDFEGKLINLNKPVKIWGVRATPRKGFAGILYVERVEQ